MALDLLQSVDIIETMENFIDRARPPLEVRPSLDLGYEIKDQSIILHEIRPDWQNPDVIRTFDFAKATFVHTRNHWTIFWLRASGKWETYAPCPSVAGWSEFLAVVEEDAHHCFRG